MGDFYAKVGCNNTGYEDTMEKHGVGIMDENGTHLATFFPTQRKHGVGIMDENGIHMATIFPTQRTTQNHLDIT